MQEIHQIQERFFEEEKKMSSRQRVLKLHEEAAEIIKKYGLKIKTISKA